MEEPELKKKVIERMEELSKETSLSEKRNTIDDNLNVTYSEKDVAQAVQKLIKTVQGNYNKSPSKLRILDEIKEIRDFFCEYVKVFGKFLDDIQNLVPDKE